MIYMTLFTLSAMIYLLLFGHAVVFVSMLALSLISIATSVLSDRATVRQFISILVLSGANKKAVVRCLNAYIAVRALPAVLAYTIYKALAGPTYAPILVLLQYLIAIAVMSEATYRVMRR